MKYTITGATGHLGKIVVQNMINLVGSENVRAAVHTPAKAAQLTKSGVEVVKTDYLDIATMTTSFEGTDVLIYIPSKTYNVLQRVTEFENTLIAMKQANVTEIIFVSFFADQENNPFTMSAYYGYVPRRLAGSGLKYAVIKNSLYADPLIPYLPELIERKHLIYPVGNERLSFITQKDSAEAIANLAIKAELRNHGQIYTLTQVKAYKMTKLGKIMSKVTDEKIGYAPVSVTEFADIYASEGDGTELGSMYQAGAMGLMDLTTADFKQLTGHDPETMTDFLSKNYQK
ncbi:NAD(P)H-binding protein [Pediococcus ethanolidurans]|uniref:NmrA family NAD(P)-binding protein n=1 Tax=Pediococcus ethanolidurans TaxID=319653 RepID=UPI002954B07F|nr:NAD(P)H-binding protein [Pediococcus ethanolidurans]MDV7718967.1 NAD(P)H-binding protein [Pediococcus ethanolidurans]